MLLGGSLKLTVNLAGGSPYNFRISEGILRTNMTANEGYIFELNNYDTIRRERPFQIRSLSNSCGVGQNSNIVTLKKIIKYCYNRYDFRFVRKFSMSQGAVSLVSFADLGGFYPDPLFNKNNVIVVKKGQQYDLKFSDNIDGNENVGIWLDTNRDSLFSTSEKIYQSNISNALIRTGTLMIPSTATTGLTRMRVRVSKYATEIIPDGCSLPTNLFFTSEVYGTRDFGLLILDNNTTAISLRENTALNGCFNTTIPMNIDINGVTPNNINYRLELSDINGLWQNPLVIGTSTTSPINITIPNNLSTNGNYQLRLLSDSPNTYYFQNERAFNYFDKMKSIKSGNWNISNIWSCGRLPQVVDDVYISNGHTVKLENYTGNAKSIFLDGFLQYLNGSVKIGN